MAETPGNHENKQTSFMTLISCDARQLYPSSLGTMACSCAVERKEVMGGTDHDKSLHKIQGANTAEPTTPINCDLSLIPHFAYAEESWASCRILLCPTTPYSAAAQLRAVSQHLAACLCLQEAWPRAAEFSEGAPGTGLNSQLNNQIPPERAWGGPYSQTRGQGS